MPSHFRQCALLVCLANLLLLGCVDQSPLTEEPVAEKPDSPTNASAPNAEDQSEAPATAPAVVAGSLDIGDPAPALQIADWMKGEPVTEFQDDKVYVVEFWATWCGPCRMGMPHLSELQETYGDEVTIVSITKEDPNVVQSFFEKPVEDSVAEYGETWNDVMRYRVAVDDEGATTAAYMRAAGENGIPNAYVVGHDGKIEWIGHPGNIDGVLKKVTARNWDRQAAATKRKLKKELKERMQQFQVELRQAMGEENWDEALSLVEEHAEKFPDSIPTSSIKFSILNAAGRFEEAATNLEKIVEQMGDNAPRLNALAWSIASGDEPAEPLLNSALDIAQRAAELTGFANGDVLDTVARVHHELGHADKAIEWQKRAVETDPDNENYQETLDGYLELTESDEAEEPDAENTEAASPATEETEAEDSEAESVAEPTDQP